ncbi:MAG: molecular chaperone HscB [Gammaproteobacteria bacterium]|jgi:molecular chaperone HscB
MEQNYFALFDIEPVFDINPVQLREMHQTLQAEYHPDRHVMADAQQKRISVQNAATINDAYQTLKEPIKRARYLLGINGVDLGDENETTSDMVFLMEQIEHREVLEGCRSHENPLDACEALIQKLALRVADLEKEFVENFDNQQLEKARQVSRKMQFIERIQSQANELFFELEDEFI